MSDNLSETQKKLVKALDVASKSVSNNFDADEYKGLSTLGFAHISNVSGNSSFIRGIKSLANEHSENRVSENNGRYKVSFNSLELSVSKSHGGGYRVSVSNVSNFVNGPEYQRMDVREKLNQLVLDSLQNCGYLNDSYVSSRMD